MLAQFDSSTRRWTSRPVDLASIAAEAVSAARLAQPDRTIALHADDAGHRLADGGRIRQVIDNLVGNAVLHTPRGSPVTVTVTGSPGTGPSPSPTTAPA